MTSTMTIQRDAFWELANDFPCFIQPMSCLVAAAQWQPALQLLVELVGFNSPMDSLVTTI